MLYCLVMWVCELRSLRRSRVHVGASSQGARRGVGADRFGFPKFQSSVNGVDSIYSLRFTQVVPT